MAGGTSVPPQDSRCEPWSGQKKDFWLEKEKTCGRTKRSRRSDGEVSLDNADAVIEGAPHVGFTCGAFISVPSSEASRHHHGCQFAREVLHVRRAERPHADDAPEQCHEPKWHARDAAGTIPVPSPRDHAQNLARGRYGMRKAGARGAA